MLIRIEILQGVCNFTLAIHMTHIEGDIQQFSQASKDFFDLITKSCNTQKADSEDDDPEDDVFFGTVITREEMRIIKKRGLSNKRRETMKVVHPFEIESESDSSNNTNILSIVSANLDSNTTQSLNETVEWNANQKNARTLTTLSDRKSITQDQKSRGISLDLNKITLANTKRNSEYHFVEINYEDVFESGPRPPSPSSHVKKLYNNNENDSCQTLSLSLTSSDDVVSNRKSTVKWSTDLIKTDDIIRKNPSQNSYINLKSCLKQPKNTNFDDILQPSPQKSTVSVRRIYYKDDEQLKHLLTSVPTILDQMLGKSKRKISSSWNIIDDASSEHCESPNHKKEISYENHHESRNEKKRSTSHSVSAIGPPQRNEKS